MAVAGTVVSKLSELVDGQEAVCFAALVKKSRGVTKANQPYLKCVFRDKRLQVESPLWHDSRCFRDADLWVEGTAFRLHVQCRHDVRFGLQLDILSARAATEADAADGYDFFDLVPSSRFSPEELLKKLDLQIDRSIDHPALKQLVRNMIDENLALFERMPAAQNMHHSYTSGLLEHVWSMTRIAGFLADHYAKYYDSLDPPLNRGLIVAATVLHDIGKLRELEYHPVETRYTKEGTLVGHVLMGRDMVARRRRPDRGIPRRASAVPRARDPGAPRQARVRRPDRPGHPRGPDRLVYRRPGCQGQHGGPQGASIRRMARPSPKRSSRSRIAGSTAGCRKGRPSSQSPESAPCRGAAESGPRRPTGSPVGPPPPWRFRVRLVRIRLTV